jgi:molybdate/tungstate transport system substrate-binding protein
MSKSHTLKHRQTPRRWLIAATASLLALGAGIGAAQAQTSSITVVYAGSMGALMDRGIAPAFTAKTGTTVHGTGDAAMALAHLITAKTINPDVFVSVSAPPIKVVKAAGLSQQAMPVASSGMVLAYSPASKFAAQFAKPNADVAQLLMTPGLRIGRTDPRVDPQGQYVLFVLQLAETYYKQPGLAQQVAGPTINPAEIFAEPSLLARLRQGQIDATIGYESAVISQHLPFITLPAEINFSNPAYQKDWYSQAKLTLSMAGTTKTVHPSPLVYYATVLKNAKHPQAAEAYVKFLTSPQGQALFAKYGYDVAKGPSI